MQLSQQFYSFILCAVVFRLNKNKGNNWFSPLDGKFLNDIHGTVGISIMPLLQVH